MTNYDKSYGSVPLSKVKAAIDQIEKQLGPEVDPQITFEYLVGSFFPEVVENVHKEARIQYDLGFQDGLKLGRETK